MMKYINFKHRPREKKIHNLIDCKFNSLHLGLLTHVIDCRTMAVDTVYYVIQTKQLRSGISSPQEISTFENCMLEKKTKSAD